LAPKYKTAPASANTDSTGLPSTLLLSELIPGIYQPRTHMDEGALYELAESIKAQGIMQPILVRKLGVDLRYGDHAGKYEIIAGERRFRAAKLAGLDSVPVLVKDVPDSADWGVVTNPVLHDKSNGTENSDYCLRANNQSWTTGCRSRRETNFGGLTQTQSFDMITYTHTLRRVDADGSSAIVGDVNMQKYSEWLQRNYNLTIAYQ
jgi:ParB-like nuclease domain